MVKAIRGCIAVILAALLLLPIFENIQAWFPIRFALGAGATILVIASQTWVNRIVPDHARGKIIGLFGLLWTAGFAAGPLALRITGIVGWPPFLVAIGLAAAATLPLLFASNTLSTEPPRIAKKGLLTVLRIGGPAIGASMVLGVLDSVSDSFLPLYGLRNGLRQESAVTMLTVLLAGVLTIQLPIGWASDRMSRTGLLAIVTALALLMSLLLPYAVASEFGLWPNLFVLGMASGGIWTVSLVLVGQRFQGSDLAAASVLQSLLYGLGSVLAPPFTGFALETSGRIGLPLVLAVDCAMFMLLQFWVLRGRRERA
jgi:MFS family permease